MFKNYFKPTSKKVETILLSAKGFIGTISVAAFFQGDPKAAFYFLLSGAGIDFLLRCLSDDSANQNPTFKP